MKKIILIPFIFLGSCNPTLEIVNEIENDLVSNDLYIHEDFMFDSTQSWYSAKNRDRISSTYLKSGIYKGKNIGHLNISDVFSDWEILMIIKRMEGFYDGSSRIAVIHNNPGNLKYGAFSKSYGATRGTRETFYGEGDYYAKFPNDSLGSEAALRLIQVIRKNHPTIKGFFKRWSSETGSINYVRFVNQLASTNNYPLD